MAKKKGGKSKGYVSAGTVRNVNKKTLNAMRNETTLLQRTLYKVDAWKAGKNPWVTVPNKGGDQAKMPYVRVKANTYWGNPNARVNVMKTGDRNG